MNLLKDAKWTVGPLLETPFMKKYDIYQDGTTPMHRDKDGRLWAMSGHTHMGHIGMFCGTCLDDLKEVYPITTNFKTGKAGEAFDCVKYPEGVLPRGSIWPFGLYICRNTNRFFCFFHNETGWNGKGTGYIIHGPGDGEPDFRHIGLMHSDDCGKTWDFDRWVITSEDVCYSELYRPDNIKIGGQPAGMTSLGSGDFSIFIEPDGEYIYLFYGILMWDSFAVGRERKNFKSCDVYAARTRRRDDGTCGDFVKYYNGSFCEPGNLGKETKIVTGAWHPRVIYSKTLDAYIMSSQLFEAGENPFTYSLAIRTSTDLINWSEPVILKGNGDELHKHYFALLSNSADTPHNVIENEFSVLCCNNGTDVQRYKVKFER